MLAIQGAQALLVMVVLLQLPGRLRLPGSRGWPVC